ncbi:Hsp33 family molecular chaperone HslO [Ornithinibacillus sp. 4-3]|uniref:Hsp33 family molecular chaperone HslO n=1 Tax=Ornithinibacillus sp. 4-3 TaxID=3231488 RepID=A0AB39HQ72_9BACI
MKNTIVKTLIYDNQVRLFFANNTELINKILTKNKNIHPIHKQMLGKTISVISILTGTLKGEQRISLQITLSEPKYKIFADADAKGNVRGYLNDALLHAPMQHDTSFADLIGSKGTIRVVKGSAMNQFIGITDMPYQNIIDDISHYFIQSEQTQTYIAANISFTNDNNIQFSSIL